MNQRSTPSQDLALRFSHDVIEHLGLKLYQNKPTNVVAELVSNAWDADAQAVWIDLKGQESEDKWISVSDSGSGMTFDQIRDHYLVVAKKRRGRKNEVTRSQGGRPLMGRKGIGKLAPFGIANIVEVVSVATTEHGRKVNWFKMDLTDILEAEEEVESAEQQVEEKIDSNEQQTGQNSKSPFAEYPPEIFAREEVLERLSLDKDDTGAVKAFLDNIGDGNGTLVILKSLKHKRIVDQNKLCESLGRRFTVTFLDPTFKVHVDGDLIDEVKAMPEFEFRIPSKKGDVATTRLDDRADREIRYWVGFVKKASWSSDESGVGIYAHGKIAQDRPFTFKVKGLEVQTRYMYAVVEAEWLDEQPEDLISTDRTTIDWETEDTEKLFKWGQDKVREWTREYEKYRHEQDNKDLTIKIQEAIKKKTIPKVSIQEQSQIADLLSKVTPKVNKDSETQEKLIAAVTDAWLQKPMRTVVKKLWRALDKDENQSPEAFGYILQQLNEQRVPEALSFAVAFAQKGYALTMLDRLVMHKKEVQLQKLLEKFPWIICPEKPMLTANLSLATAIKDAEAKGEIATVPEPEGIVATDAKRPDFVFLSSAGQREFFIVELKRPDQPLTHANMVQLESYCSYIAARHPDTPLEGMLIGSGDTTKLALQARKNITITTWDKLITHSRFTLLKNVLASWREAGTDSDDDRVIQIKEFSGKSMIELMKNICANDDRFDNFFSELEESIDEGFGATAEAEDE